MSLRGVITNSNKRIYLTGLKKCVIQNTFFISFDILSESIFNGMEEVFDETKAEGLRRKSILL